MDSVLRKKEAPKPGTFLYFFLIRLWHASAKIPGQLRAGGHVKSFGWWTGNFFGKAVIVPATGCEYNQR